MLTIEEKKKFQIERKMGAAKKLKPLQHLAMNKSPTPLDVLMPVRRDTECSSPKVEYPTLDLFNKQEYEHEYAASLSSEPTSENERKESLPINIMVPKTAG